MEDKLKDKIFEGFLIVFIVVFALCGVIYTIHTYIGPTEERSIAVVNKTIEIVSHDSSPSTEYLILGDDGIVYHARNWKMYYDMKIGERYNVTVKNCDSFWRIEEIKEM